MTRVAAVDCGTNSLRLLVTDLDAGGGPATELAREMTIVRLGQGVDRTGRFAPAAIARTLAALRHYAEVIRRLGAERVRMVATSATRDAANRDEFVRGVHEILGVGPEVISGDEEARLSFLGATRELRGVDAPYLVVDIGGGSTEFVLGATGVEAARSVDIGCVRMTERHLHGDPPSTDQVAAAVRDIDAGIALAGTDVPLARAATVVGLAGSVTTVAAVALGLSAYDAARIHHARISRRQVHDVATALLTRPHAERAANPVIHPGRVDVIGAGALVLDRLLTVLDRPEVLVSEHDILDGIALSMHPADG